MTNRFDWAAHMQACKQAEFEHKQHKYAGGGSPFGERKIADYGPQDELEMTLGLAQAYLDDLITSLQERTALCAYDEEEPL